MKGWMGSNTINFVSNNTLCAFLSAFASCQFRYFGNKSRNNILAHLNYSLYFYSLLKNNLYISLHSEEYSVYFTPFWIEPSLFYSILKDILYIFFHSEEYSLYFTLFWRISFIFFLILKSILCILLYSE